MAGSSISPANSIQVFSDFSFRIRSFNPLLIKFSPPPSRPLKHSRRNLSVTNVISDPKLNLSVTEHEGLNGGVDNSFALDSGAIASSIKYHAEFTPSFSPRHFELPKAFFATAESVRDMLIIDWNATYEYYDKANVKQAYYLSMEFLQSLLNAIGNLGLLGAHAEALKKLGYDLEAVAEQEPDPALENGGLGRLASCFLDSLATLNYSAWGYGLRYKVITRPDWSKEWIGGEDIQAVAYDVPIPGYKAKTTINLRLWYAKVPSEGFNVKDFNAGEHAKAYEALKNAEKICYVLYHETLEGKTLRLKQQYTLCSASLQDIIASFEKRSGEAVNWEAFPEKVAVQMNDTHPTLCIPELLRILMDIRGPSWDGAWKITQKYVIPQHFA